MRLGSLIVHCNFTDPNDRPTSDVLEWELAHMFVWLFGPFYMSPTQD